MWAARGGVGECLTWAGNGEGAEECERLRATPGEGEARSTRGEAGVRNSISLFSRDLAKQDNRTRVFCAIGVGKRRA